MCWAERNLMFLAVCLLAHGVVQGLMLAVFVFTRPTVELLTGR